jgi:malate dehydrogenase (oxaloacetate-decarboxylating)(NADP+)
VRGAYEGSEFSFGRDYLIPKPFDGRVLFHVAPAVARAAMESGIARTEVDMQEYQDRLRASLGPGREVMRWMIDRARRRPARVVFSEGHNETVIRAASQLVEEGICRPILVARPDRLQEIAKDMGVDLTGIDVVFAADEDEKREAYASELFERRGRKGLTRAEADWNLFKPIYYAASLLQAGEADALVAGVEANYAEILRPCLEVVGASGGGRVSGLYMLAFPNRELMFIADATVNIEPDAQALAEIATQTAGFVKELGIVPRIAMVSFSNFGSTKHEESQRVADAVKIVRSMDPDLEIDGEMQADTAVDPIKLRQIYPFTHLKGPANVLVFSRLSAANAAYKLLDQLGGADVIGPVLLGMAKPVHVLQRGCSAQDVTNLATVAAVDWQARSGSS